MDKIGPMLLGIALILDWVADFFIPVYYSTKYSKTIDNTGFNIPLGLFKIAVGIGFLWVSFRKKK